MNNLSWLLLLSEVSASIKIICIVFGILGGIALCVYFIVTTDMYGDQKKLHWTKFKNFFVLWLICVLLAAALPTKTTLYLIAASETGEEAFKSETGKKAKAALDRYLDSIGKEEED